MRTAAIPRAMERISGIVVERHSFFASISPFPFPRRYRRRVCEVFENAPIQATIVGKLSTFEYCIL